LGDETGSGQWVEDAIGDAAVEVVACNGTELAVISPYGGRLIYWFDLKAATQLAGNHLAVVPARYESGTCKAPKLAARPERWLPETDEPSLKSWAAARQKEAPPTALGRRLPAWLFEKETDELITYRSPEALGEPRQPLAAQVGALCECISVDVGPATRLDELLDYRFEPAGVVFLLFPAPDVYVEKHLTQSAGALTARYVIDNRDEVAHQVRLVSIHELNPDYQAVLGQGRDVLSYALHDERWPSVKNTASGQTLVVQPSRPWQSVACSPMLLALEVRLTFDLEVGPRSQEMLELNLRRARPPRPRRTRAAKAG
jgi:hypothetical protein